MNVIFTTNTRSAWGNNQPSKKGSLYILNHDGTLLTYHELPDGYMVSETRHPLIKNGQADSSACDTLENGVIVLYNQ